MKNIIAGHLKSFRASTSIRIALIVGLTINLILPVTSEAITVMPLGDSLTQGVEAGDSPDYPGYRSDLYDSLQNAGFAIEYVGPFLDPDGRFRHGGAVGSTTADVKARWEAFTPKPSVVLLMVGTNDFRGINVPSPGYCDPLLTQHIYDAWKVLADEIAADLAPVSGTLFVASISPFDYGWRGNTFTAPVAGNCPGGVPQGSGADLQRISDELLEDFNNRIKNYVVERNDPNIRFVDINSAVSLDWIGDQVHPFAVDAQGYPPAYLNMARTWYFAWINKFATLYTWIADDGDWSNAGNWQTNPGHDPLPSLYSNVLLKNDTTKDRTVTYQEFTAPRVSLLTIDAIGGSGTGSMQLSQTAGNLGAHMVIVGDVGAGTLAHNGGAASVDFVELGKSKSSIGTYTLGENSALVAFHEYIGYHGQGDFVQNGGTNMARGSLNVGVFGPGSYTLQNGTMSAVSETVGYENFGKVVQNGGTNRLYVFDPAELGDQGTLWIARGSGGSGTYALGGGTLTALSISNGDQFFYTGGSLAVAKSFINYGDFRVVGTRAFQGDLIQQPSGELMITVVKNANNEFVGSLNISQNPMNPANSETPANNGAAKLAGVIKVNLVDGESSLSTGSTFELLSATQVVGFQEGLENVDLFQTLSFNLPTLSGDKILRPSLVGGKIQLSYVDADCGDHAAVKPAFGKKRGQVGFNGAADFNGDGVVDMKDLNLIRQKVSWNTCPGFH